MKKRIKKTKQCTNFMSSVELRVTKHVIERFRERNGRYSCASEEKIKNIIIEQVRHSKLVMLKGVNEELRSCFDNMYVIKKDREKGRDVFIVITLTLSKQKLRKFNMTA